MTFIADFFDGMVVPMFRRIDRLAVLTRPLIPGRTVRASPCHCLGVRFQPCLQCREPERPSPGGKLTPRFSITIGTVLIDGLAVVATGGIAHGAIPIGLGEGVLRYSQASVSSRLSIMIWSIWVSP